MFRRVKNAICWSLTICTSESWSPSSTAAMHSLKGLNKKITLRKNILKIYGRVLKDTFLIPELEAERRKRCKRRIFNKQKWEQTYKWKDRNLRKTNTQTRKYLPFDSLGVEFLEDWVTLELEGIIWWHVTVVSGFLKDTFD